MLTERELVFVAEYLVDKSPDHNCRARNAAEMAGYGYGDGQRGKALYAERRIEVAIETVRRVDALRQEYAEYEREQAHSRLTREQRGRARPYPDWRAQRGELWEE